MIIFLALPLGLFILLEIFLYVNKTLNKAPMWLLIDTSLFCTIIFSHFFDLWDEIPGYFWVIIIIWILLHYFIIRQFFKRKKIY